MLSQRMLRAGLLVFLAMKFVHQASNGKGDKRLLAIQVAAAESGALVARRGFVPDTLAGRCLVWVESPCPDAGALKMIKWTLFCRRFTGRRRSC